MSKVLPRKRTVGEKIVAALEFAALVRTLARVFGRKKRRRIPARAGLLAIVGAGVLAAVVAALLAKRKASGGESEAPAAPATPPEQRAADKPGNDSAADHVKDADPVPAAVEASKTLDTDAPNQGATGDHPTEEEKPS
jgi:hypothetical protein